MAGGEVTQSRSRPTGLVAQSDGVATRVVRRDIQTRSGRGEPHVVEDRQSAAGPWLIAPIVGHRDRNTTGKHEQEDHGFSSVAGSI
jgi:hypothetical protein